MFSDPTIRVNLQPGSYATGDYGWDQVSAYPRVSMSWSLGHAICTRDAAAAVCGTDLGIDVASALTALVDKSLLSHLSMPDGNSR